MSVKAGVPIDGATLAAATAAIFTVATTLNRAVITSSSFHANVGAQLQVFVVPSGGSPTTANQIIDRALSADETYTSPELVGKGLETGDTIQANDGVGGSINFVGTVTTFDGNS